MNFWTAVVIIVALGTFSGVYTARLRALSKRSNEDYDDFANRLAILEDRMANLETIVLEKERAKEYEKL